MKMTEFLVKHFVKNYEKVSDVEVRTAYGILASFVGIGCNLILFAAKLAVFPLWQTHLITYLMRLLPSSVLLE